MLLSYFTGLSYKATSSEGALVTCSNRKCTVTLLPLRTFGRTIHLLCSPQLTTAMQNKEIQLMHTRISAACEDAWTWFNVKGDSEHLAARTATLCYPNLVPHSLTATVEKVWLQKGTYTCSSAALVPTWCINSSHQLLLPPWRECAASCRGCGGQQGSRPWRASATGWPWGCASQPTAQTQFLWHNPPSLLELAMCGTN